MNSQDDARIRWLLIGICVGLALVCFLDISNRDRYLVMGICATGVIAGFIRDYRHAQKAKDNIFRQDRSIGGYRVTPRSGGHPWHCADYRHTHTHTDETGRSTKIYVVTRVVGGCTQQAVSIDGRRPAGDDWTTGSIENARFTNRCMRYTITYPENTRESENVEIEWP